MQLTFPFLCTLIVILVIRVSSSSFFCNFLNWNNATTLFCFCSSALHLRSITEVCFTKHGPHHPCHWCQIVQPLEACRCWSSHVRLHLHRWFKSGKQVMVPEQVSGCCLHRTLFGRAKQPLQGADQGSDGYPS